MQTKTVRSVLFGRYIVRQTADRYICWVSNPTELVNQKKKYFDPNIFPFSSAFFDFISIFFSLWKLRTMVSVHQAFIIYLSKKKKKSHWAWLWLNNADCFCIKSFTIARHSCLLILHCICCCHLSSTSFIVVSFFLSVFESCVHANTENSMSRVYLCTFLRVRMRLCAFIWLLACIQANTIYWHEKTFEQYTTLLSFFFFGRVFVDLCVVYVRIYFLHSTKSLCRGSAWHRTRKRHRCFAVVCMRVCHLGCACVCVNIVAETIDVHMYSQMAMLVHVFSCWLCCVLLKDQFYACPCVSMCFVNIASRSCCLLLHTNAQRHWNLSHTITWSVWKEWKLFALFGCEHTIFETCVRAYIDVHTRIHGRNTHRQRTHASHISNYIDKL